MPRVHVFQKKLLGGKNERRVALLNCVWAGVAVKLSIRVKFPERTVVPNVDKLRPSAASIDTHLRASQRVRRQIHGVPLRYA